MHFQTHSVICLDIHLPDQQTVIFKEGVENEVIADSKNTKLHSFFDLIKLITKHDVLYHTISLPLYTYKFQSQLTMYI